MGKTVATIIAEGLEEMGVKDVFGVPGGQICPVYDALTKTNVRSILTRHEQCAAYMADAYARVTGKAGICLATVGPGVTNLATGLYLSHTDSIPVLALCGQNPVSTFGKGVMQELDHVTFLRSITKWTAQLTNPERAAEFLVRAYHLATSGRCGPVHLDLPVDMLLREVPESSHKWRLNPIYCRVRPCIEAVKEAVKMLLEAKQPLMFVGGGIAYGSPNAADDVLSLAELLDIPVATTLNGMGAFASTHPIVMGRVGLHAPDHLNEYVWNADVILALGCRFSTLSTNAFRNINPSAKIIQIDIDPSQFNRSYPIALGIVADLKEGIAALLEEATNYGKTRKGNNSYAKFCRKNGEWLANWALKATSDDQPIKPQRLAREIREFYDKETIFAVDAGNVHLWPTYEPVLGPGTWINSGAGAPMGYALPAAIAVKLAKPERESVALIGDGGLAMTIQELFTASQYKIPITVIIFNNSSLGYIRHLQQVQFYNRITTSELINPDFAGIAKASGWYGEKIEKPGEVRLGLERARKATTRGQSALLDVIIDTEEKVIDFENTYKPGP